MHYTNWKWHYDILCVPDGIIWITGITDEWEKTHTHNLTWNEENLDLWSVEIICVLFVNSTKEYTTTHKNNINKIDKKKEKSKDSE